MTDKIEDLKNNINEEHWARLIDDFDQRIAELHKNIDFPSYSDWSLSALQALQGDQGAKLTMENVQNNNEELKHSLDEMAMLYLIQPMLRHYLYRSINHNKENNPPS